MAYHWFKICVCVGFICYTFAPLQDFDKEEKRKIVEEADAEYKAFQDDPVTKFSVPPELSEQRKEAMKHWENLCSIVDAEEQAEQVNCCDGIVFRDKTVHQTHYSLHAPGFSMNTALCGINWIDL